MEKIEHFCYLGSIVSAKLVIDLEMERRIQAAATALFHRKPRRLYTELHYCPPSYMYG